MSSKVAPSYGAGDGLTTNYDHNYNQPKTGYGPSPAARERPIGYGPSPMNNHSQKNGYGPSPPNNQRNGYGPNANYNNGASNRSSSQDDSNLYFKNPPNRTHSFKKLPKTEQELSQRYEEYQQYTKLINDYLPKEKCARCKTLKTFDCEHATPVRDDLNFNYFKTGHFYTTPKQIRELNMIKSSSSNNKRGNGGGVEMSRSTNNLYEPNVMASSRNDLRPPYGGQHNAGSQYDSYNNVNKTKSVVYNTNAAYSSNTTSTMNTNTTTTANVNNTNTTTTNQQANSRTVKKKKKDDDPDGCCSIQ